MFEAIGEFAVAGGVLWTLGVLLEGWRSVRNPSGKSNCYGEIK